MNLIEYEITLDSFAHDNSNFVFNNSGIDHAAIFTKTIYKYSTRIKMLCHGLGSKLAKDERYLLALQEFLDKPNSELTIIVISTNHINDPALCMIREKAVEFPARFKLYQAPKDSDFTNSSHIMIGDDRIFRLENEPKSFKAIGSFNRPSVVEELNRIFDGILQKSVKIYPSV